MPRRTASVCVCLIGGLLLPGCASSVRPAPAVSNEAAAPTTTTALHSPAGVQTTADAVAQALTDLGFASIHGSGRAKPVRPAVADALFARIDTETASGHRVEATCRVDGAGTVVQVSSSLPVNEHAFVVDRVRAALPAHDERPGE